MASISSTALDRSQEGLNCAGKAQLYNLIGMKIGERIKLARERLPGMTQAKLAEPFGITYQAVSAWERGADEPENAKLPVLRRELRVTFAWLLQGDGPPPNPDDFRVKLDDLGPIPIEAPAPAPAESPKSGKKRRAV